MPGRLAGRGTGRGPGGRRSECILCFLGVRLCDQCSWCALGGGGVIMVRRRSTVRFRKGAPGHGEYSNIHPVTFGPSGALSGALFDVAAGQ